MITDRTGRASHWLEVGERRSKALIAAARSRIAGSARLRIIRLAWEVSHGLAITLGLFVLAEGLLPNLAWIALGRATGRIPAAVSSGLGSSAGHSLLVSLAVGITAYALSLMRTPIQHLLQTYCSAVMTAGMQRSLASAVSGPVGVEHLEDPAVLNRLSAVSGELTSTQPADAPMALASSLGDRLGGLGACLVLAWFRWWLGLLMLVGWLLVRPPLRRLLAERANVAHRATPALRHSWYYLLSAWQPQHAKEIRLFGLSDWILGRHQDQWTAGMEPSWAVIRQINRRVLAWGGFIVAMYVVGAGVLGLAADQHEISLGTLAVMLPMMAMSMQVGGVSAADVALEQMLAAVPDLDSLVSSLGGAADVCAVDEAGPDVAQRHAWLPATGLPARQVRLESVSYRYPHGEMVLDGLDLELTAGRSLALVGPNGAGKTTLVTLLARLREPTRGRILVDGVDLRNLDARSWQRQVSVVYQDFTRYPLTARENVALYDLGKDADPAILGRVAGQAEVDPIIDRLALGWDTICSPQYAKGADLSGGQWQRIALARALYAVARGARLLILDEPTAQLDVRAEAAFYDRFLEITSDVTTLVISHRFSSVRRADQIAVLAEGKIAELGSHDELVAAKGKYEQMFTLQASRFVTLGPEGRRD